MQFYHFFNDHFLCQHKVDDMQLTIRLGTFILTSMEVEVSMIRQTKVLLLPLIIFSLLIGCTIEGWDYTGQYHGIGVGYDGELEFTLLQPEGQIEPRSGHASVVFHDAIWVFGGYNPNARGDRSAYLSDVWYTEDGYTWQKVTDDAPWKVGGVIKWWYIRMPST